MTTLDPKIVAKVSRTLAGRQPKATHLEAREAVEQLRESARRAPEIVAQVSRLDSANRTSQIPVYVVDRTRWAEAAAESFNSIVDVAERHQNRRSHAGFDSAVRALTSAGLGAGLSIMAAGVLGQYDPFLAGNGASDEQLRGRLILVAPNIVGFGRAYNLDPSDLALWVSVHELTHAAQFAQAPWIRDYVISRVVPLIGAKDASAISMSEGPGGDLTAMMSLLEGHAEYMMNNVSRRMIPTLKRLKSAMATRRAQSNPLKALIYKATGMDLKMAQYSTGQSFVQAVIREAGVEAFNEIWADPLNAPSPAELAAPLTWVHRVL